MDRVNEVAAEHQISHNFIIERRSGVDELKKRLQLYSLKGNLKLGDLTYVSNARHIALLNQALASD